MTIGSIIIMVIGGLVLIAGIVGGVAFIVDGDGGFGAFLLILALIISAACIVTPLVYKNTEAGKRALKDQKSNFGDGIERTVTVYDINGEVIEKYSGKFDVETNSSYILFDDEKGKRHMIYYTTGTVIIDEK